VAVVIVSEVVFYILAEGWSTADPSYLRKPRGSQPPKRLGIVLVERARVILAVLAAFGSERFFAIR
jgi:hypothetical protein